MVLVEIMMIFLSVVVFTVMALVVTVFVFKVMAVFVPVFVFKVMAVVVAVFVFKVMAVVVPVVVFTAFVVDSTMFRHVCKIGHICCLVKYEKDLQLNSCPLSLIPHVSFTGTLHTLSKIIKCNLMMF